MLSFREVVSKIAFIPKAILNSYSIILFSYNRWIGLLLLSSTFLAPIVGISGLIGVLIALLTARLLGFEPWNSTSGILSFNSLLTCLGIGFYFPVASYGLGVLYLLLFIGSIFTLLLYITLDNLLYGKLKIPSMSMSFSIVSIFMWLFLMRIGHSQHLPHNQMYVMNFTPVVPVFVLNYFQSIGGIFFQPYFLTGLCIAVALFFISRIGFLLSIIGYTVGYFFIIHWGGKGASDVFYPGFNMMLAAFAIGGIFLVPSRISYLLAIIAAFIGIVIAFSIETLFRDFMIPPFALPFNVTVYMIIYALQLRLKNRNPYVNDFNILHPELALEYYLSHINRFARSGVPQFFLPITGEWTVTQGNHGEITHKSDWAYAWDFEIMDREGKNYHHHAEEVDDYYCYGKAVYASAGGYVAKIVDGIADNRINQINTEQKWGNYLTIQHGIGVYSLYAHLKSGSVKLKVGDYIPQGEKIALIGNSGRSAVPHLHFHIQTTYEAGSKTLFSNIANYKKREKVSQSHFISFGNPKLADLISPLMAELNLQEIMHFLLFQKLSFDVTIGKRHFEENWEVEVTLIGTFNIHSDRGSYLDFSVYNGIYNALAFRGNRKSALYAFALLLSRYPYAENQTLEWNDTPSFSVMMKPLIKQIVLLISSIGNPFKFNTKSISHSEDNKHEVESLTTVSFLGKLLISYEGRIQMEKKTGIEMIDIHKNGKEYLQAQRIQDKKS